jgi:glycosyltransferase involved in cell wall biosynthesis
VRVAFDARMVTWKGIGTYSLELLRALAARRKDEGLEVSAFRLPDDHFVEKDPSLADLRWQVVPGSVWSPLALLKVGQAASRTVDLFHSPHFLVPPTYRGPLITTIYDLIPLDHPETMPNPAARRVFEAAVHFAATRADMVLCLTRFSAARLAAHRIAPRDLSIIPGAAPAGLMPAGAAEIERVAHKYGLPPGYVLWIGAFRAHKNTAALLKAYRLLPRGLSQRHPLVLAGGLDGALATALQQRAPREHFPVLLPGRIEAADMAGLYSGASAFVFPSLIEGFGLPPLEAAACGAPVLCSSAEPMPDVMGTAAVYFDPLDVPVLAGLIETVLSSPETRRRLSAAGLRQAHAYSWDTAAELTVRAYRAVALRRGG